MLDSVFEEHSIPLVQGPDFPRIHTHDLSSSFPFMIIGCAQEYNHRLLEQRIRDTKNWFIFTHQSGGTACEQFGIIGKAYRLSNKGKSLAGALDKEFFGKSCAMLGLSLSEILSYKKILDESLYELNAEYSYAYLKEALYPLDFSASEINVLIDGNVSEDLDDLVSWSRPLDRIIGSVGRWTAFLVHENAD